MDKKVNYVIFVETLSIIDKILLILIVIKNNTFVKITKLKKFLFFDKQS